MTDPASGLNITTGDEGVTCAGEIDAHTAPDLEQALSGIQVGSQPITLDMADVTFIDSSGIRTLISSTTATRDQGGDIVIVPSPMVTRVVKMSGLDTFFTMADATTDDN